MEKQTDFLFNIHLLRKQNEYFQLTCDNFLLLVHDVDFRTFIFYLFCHISACPKNDSGLTWKLFDQILILSPQLSTSTRTERIYFPFCVFMLLMCVRLYHPVFLAFSSIYGAYSNNIFGLCFYFLSIAHLCFSCNVFIVIKDRVHIPSMY